MSSDKQDRQKKMSTELLRDISGMILERGDLDTTIKRVLELINSQVPSLFYIYFLKNSTNNLVLHSYTDDNLPKVLSYINFDVSKIHYPLECKDPLLCKCFNENRIVYSHYLRDFFVPVFKMPAILDIVQKSLNIESCVGLPICLNAEKKGVLFIASKESVSEDSLNLLQFYADLSAIAIDNAHQFHDLEQKYLKEKLTTAMLSHELKTPIAIAHNSAHLMGEHLRRGIKANEEHQKYLPILEDLELSINRLNYVCNSIFSLMDTENRDNSVLHAINLDRQLEQIIESYSLKARKKGLEFEYQIDEPEDIIYGGGVQLEQILMILLDNAVKYSKEGKIKLDVDYRDSKLICTVTDNGPGIKKKTKAKIFEKFYRHRERKNRNLVKIEGLGLGLYIAKKIAEKVDGEISVGDNPEGGSVFTVEIPVYDKMPETQKAA